MGAKGKMLALEISPKVIRAIEYVPETSPLEVTLAAATDWPGGEPVRVGRFLREFLSSRGFTARRAVVSYFGPLIEHRIYVLPPTTGETRADFELQDTTGKIHRLSDYRGQKVIVLAFLRGFM